jgi:hypothetical protein
MSKHHVFEMSKSSMLEANIYKINRVFFSQNNSEFDPCIISMCLYLCLSIMSIANIYKRENVRANWGVICYSRVCNSFICKEHIQS